MPSRECTVCDLEAGVRKLYEGLLRGKAVSLREVVDLSEWLSVKRENQKLKVSKSALDRHRNNGHFVADDAERVEVNPDDEIKSLREFVREAFAAFQKATKGKVPSHKEMMDLLLADAKLADIEERRRDEAVLRTLLAGAAPTSTESPSPAPEGEQRGETL